MRLDNPLKKKAKKYTSLAEQLGYLSPKQTKEKLEKPKSSKP